MIPLVWGIIIGFVGFHVAYFAVAAIIWWRVIIREKRQPPRYTQVDRIVRNVGTLTVYTSRN